MSIGFGPWPNDPGLASSIGLTALKGGQNNQNTGTLQNVVLTSQDNPLVNVLQLGVDAPQAQLKQQHITTQRATDSGPGATMAIDPGGAIGLNQPGASLYLADGLSTGNAEGGGISFQLSRPGASGSTLNARSNAFAMADITGLSAFYPQIVNNGFLGLSTNPWWFAYITNLIITSVASDSANLANSQLSMYLDPTPGATNLHFVAKDSGGTVRTATVALA